MNYSQGKKLILQNLVLIALYYLAAALSLMFAPNPGDGAPFWIPSGLSLAALIIFGPGLWPGVWIGASLAVLAQQSALPGALVVGLGNSMEALIAYYLLQKYTPRGVFLDRLSDVFKFFAVVLFSAALSASNAALIFLVSNGLSEHLLITWASWWLGDVSSLVIFTPFLINVRNALKRSLSLHRWGEVVTFFVVLILMAFIVFGGSLPENFSDTLPYLFLIFLCWAATRYTPWVTNLTAILISLMALWSTLQGMGPFANEDPVLSLASMQIFNTLLAATGLGLNAAIAERQVARGLLIRERDELEHRIYERTLELQKTNHELSLEVNRRRKIQQAEHEQRILAEALLNTTEILNSTLRLEEVLDNIMENIHHVLPFDCSNIMLVQGHMARISRCRGYALRGMEEQMRNIKLNINEVYTLQHMARTRQPLILSDVWNYPQWVKLPETTHVRAYLGAPIFHGEKLIGYLNLDSVIPGYFTSEHARRLSAFANQAAIAIENARLYSELRQLAILDDLTGLYNRRGLFELGEREVERAHRFRRPLTVLMIDIDHFKHINDTYSHSVGDQILRGLAQQLRRNIREIDILGRYGGEEFVILLPELEISRGQEVAERLRQIVENNLFPINAGELNITISVGLASVTPLTINLNMLIAQADQALYTAKNNGRNRICLYSN